MICRNEQTQCLNVNITVHVRRHKFQNKPAVQRVLRGFVNLGPFANGDTEPAKGRLVCLYQLLCQFLGEQAPDALHKFGPNH